MFGSQILDIAIAMIMFYLFISLVCTAVREGIEALTKSRAMNIERGLRELLADPTGTTIMRNLMDHPLLSGLYAGGYNPAHLNRGFTGLGPKILPNNNMGRWARQNLPSYIPSANFAAALLDLTVRGPADQCPPGGPMQLSLDAVRNSIASLPNSQVQRAILSAVDRANGDLAQAQKNLEDWFNSAMDRVSGWYKRRTQMILFVLGVFAAIALNLDSFAVLNAVSTNKSIRDGLVAAADTAKGKESDPNFMKTLAGDFQKLNLPMGWQDRHHPLPQSCVPQNVGAPPAKSGGGAPSKSSGAGPAKSGGAAPSKSGGVAATGTVECTAVLDCWSWAKIILGWLITAAAVTLGAPFWFDTLGKFMQVRSTVKPQDQQSAQAPAPAASPAAQPAA